MVMRRMVCLLTVLFVSGGAANAENHAPVVSNVQALQRPGTMLVDITYDLLDADGDTMAVTVQVSNDGGDTFQVPARTLEVDVGPGVTSGTGKRVVWNAGEDVPNMYGRNCRPKVFAIDSKQNGVVGETITLTLPGGPTLEMVWIEPGTFPIGSPDSEQGRVVDQSLQHQVTISRGFHLGLCIASCWIPNLTGQTASCRSQLSPSSPRQVS